MSAVLSTNIPGFSKCINSISNQVHLPASSETPLNGSYRSQKNQDHTASVYPHLSAGMVLSCLLRPQISSLLLFVSSFIQ